MEVSACDKPLPAWSTFDGLGLYIAQRCDFSFSEHNPCKQRPTTVTFSISIVATTTARTAHTNTMKKQPEPSSESEKTTER